MSKISNELLALADAVADLTIKDWMYLSGSSGPAHIGPESSQSLMDWSAEIIKEYPPEEEQLQKEPEPKEPELPKVKLPPPITPAPHKPQYVDQSRYAEPNTYPETQEGDAEFTSIKGVPGIRWLQRRIQDEGWNTFREKEDRLGNPMFVIGLCDAPDTPDETYLGPKIIVVVTRHSLADQAEQMIRQETEDNR